MLLLVQFRTVVFGVLAICRDGVVVFCVMICEAEVLQPFGLVTVTMYVPGVETVSTALVPTMLVPLLQE
jgi:hypothetical protein